MKKKLFFIVFVAFVFFSCTSKSDKVVSLFTSEIKVKPTVLVEKNVKETHYKWKSVSLAKNETLKNIVDKEIGILPTKTQELEQLGGVFSQYWVWENSDLIVELDYDYGATSNNIDVTLHVTKK